MGRVVLYFAAVLLGGAVGTAEAQEVRESPRWLLGASGTLGRPVGEFQRFVDWGGGLDVYSVIPVFGASPVGMRLEGSFTLYGHEDFETPLSRRVSRVTVDVTTANFIAGIGVGPQVMVRHGRFQPYAFGTAGLSYFATVSSVGSDSDHEISSTNFDDATFALSGGAGVLVGLTRGGHPVSLDLSVVARQNGEAEYLRRGGIVENADGSLTLNTIRSNANLVSFRVGVAVGL